MERASAPRGKITMRNCQRVRIACIGAVWWDLRTRSSHDNFDVNLIT